SKPFSATSVFRGTTPRLRYDQLPQASLAASSLASVVASSAYRTLSFDCVNSTRGQGMHFRRARPFFVAAVTFLGQNHSLRCYRPVFPEGCKKNPRSSTKSPSCARSTLRTACRDRQVRENPPKFPNLRSRILGLRANT